jgi:uncharacterized membrane protein
MRWLLPLSVFLAAFAASGWVTLNAIPGVIMARAMDRIAGLGAGTGDVRHAPRLREDDQTIVRASPDILYSVCVYDLADGPRRVTAPWPADGSYASVSFYDASTNNFAVTSDRDWGVSSVTIDLVAADEGGAGGADLTIASPTARGLILYRRVIDSGTDLEAADAERRDFTCARLSAR